jgi:hypothetical protein
MHISEDIIKMYLKNVMDGCGLDSSGLVEGPVSVFVYTVMKLRVPQNTGKLFRGFLRTNQLCGVGYVCVYYMYEHICRFIYRETGSLFL